MMKKSDRTSPRCFEVLLDQAFRFINTKTPALKEAAMNLQSLRWFLIVPLLFISSGCDKSNSSAPAPAPVSSTYTAPASSRAASPVPAVHAVLDSNSMTFTRLSIHDPGINNIEAISFLVPKGWTHDGGIQWFHDYSILANLLMKISDPRTGAQIEFLPIQNFTFLTNPTFPLERGANYMGNIVWEPLEDAGTIIQAFYADKVMPQLKGVSPLKQDSLDKIAQQIVQASGGRSQARATRLRYAYHFNGQPWEEDVYITATYSPYPLGTLWSVNNAYAFRAPSGQLDKLTPIMNTTVTSARLSQDWFSGYCYVQKLFNNRMNQDIKNATELSKTITRNNEEIRKLYADVYKERNDSQDRINASFGEYIRGVDTYKNPYEDRPIQLPAGYKDAWVNRAGEYILSEQQTYDPNVGSTNEWRRMDRNH